MFQFVSKIVLDYGGSIIARAAADFDGDGALELLFSGPRWSDGWVNEVQPFKLLSISNSGVVTDLSGTLPSGLGAVHAREMVVADFNGDGRPDVFSANHGYDTNPFPGEADSLLLSGAGGFTLSAGPNLRDFTHSTDAGDIDGDGDIDLLVGNMSSLGLDASGPYFLLNDGAGGFTRFQGGLSAQSLDGMTASKLLDVDQDGDLDLVGGWHSESTVSSGWVWLNDGSGQFANDPARALPRSMFGGSVTGDIAAADLDGDGDTDLVLSQTRLEPFYSGSVLQFLENDGSGRFVDVTAQRMPGQDTSFEWADKLHLVDLNGDGHLDIVAARGRAADDAAIALNDGAGRFVYVQGVTLGLSGVNWTPLDYDGDGAVDIVSFNRNLDADQPLEISVWRNMGFTASAVTAGDDQLVGGNARDTLNGDAGHDSLLGANGDDNLRGGEGGDWIAGGDGFDDTHGNMGNDTVTGGLGDDWVVGGKDNDVLFGDAGGDLVYGNLGADTCEGGDGNDVVRGGQNDDIVRGGAGDDYVSGDKGDDTVTGGTGADSFHTFGEAGLDRVLDFSIAEGDRVQLDPGTQYTVAQVGADTVISMTGGGQMVLVGVQMSALPDGWIFGA